ncbi:ATP-dependent Clp protease ATP-binding subunit [Vallitalea okinawensis]|uniref:ATP-dependent Clp protease ATP-binding subunit n=1 Tax=Vallitalea okinawensis TaxID=2078660 RepID=UPI000CFD5E2E|nr:ATP-dependent Clp protease ATP-binding subunit [Vallitalea okinawensis]
MMKCQVCNNNIAVIFINKIVNGKQQPLALCMECAKKQGISPMDHLMKQSGMSEDDINNLNTQMMSMFNDMDVNMDELADMGDDDDQSSNPFSKMFSAFTGGDGSNDAFNITNSDDTKDNEGPDIKTKKRPKPSKSRKHLDSFGINLTAKAKTGGVDRIVGRHREIDRVIQILNRRSKNNPVLIGEPGVGKTAIAEGLAVRIAEKKVPAKLYNAEIYLLDLTAVVAGTQFRGQFESRMKSILKEASAAGNVILVIDELHNIVGAGEAHGGAMNAANILKPALARGEVQIIGATTLEEYRKHIEKDSALERRFQPVIVDEPNIEESIEILKGIKDYYEKYHHVIISDDIIDAAVNLSERYITDRFLPDKAIDVIDEAGSRANLKNQGLVELEALKEDYNKIQLEKDEAAAVDDYEKVAQLRMNEIKIQEQIKAIENQCNDVDITIEDIAHVIESWTKIPVQRITELEAERLLKLENRLHERVIGQHEAIISVSKAVRRNRSDFRKKRKPSSFIFVGPTGVGKTELVRALAEELFGTEEALIRVDMSEYMEKHTVSKLIGAPPGYVGYDEGGQLTEKVRRKPYSVVLLDEIEKAHPDVFNMLLQILEDGRLTDSQGRTVNFENTIIVMTSNAGTNTKGLGMGFNNNEKAALENKVQGALKEAFRPEFLNRIDEIIIFDQLDKDELRQIVDLMLKEVYIDVRAKGLKIDVDDDVKDFLLEKGYDPKYGARPLRRTIQKFIEDDIAESYIKGELKKGVKILFIMENEKPTLKLVKEDNLLEDQGE